MNFCKECGKIIDDKYEYCWDCNERIKHESEKHLETFTCANCHQTMHSMIWPGNLCCNCYSYCIAKQNEKLKMCAKMESEFPTIKTLERDIHET